MINLVLLAQRNNLVGIILKLVITKMVRQRHTFIQETLRHPKWDIDMVPQIYSGNHTWMTQ